MRNKHVVKLTGGDASKKGVVFGKRPKKKQKPMRAIVISHTGYSKARREVMAIMADDRLIGWNSSHGLVMVRRLRANRHKIKVRINQTVGPYKKGSKRWVRPDLLSYVQ